MEVKEIKTVIYIRLGKSYFLGFNYSHFPQNIVNIYEEGDSDSNRSETIFHRDYFVLILLL